MKYARRCFAGHSSQRKLRRDSLSMTASTACPMRMTPVGWHAILRVTTWPVGRGMAAVNFSHTASQNGASSQLAPQFFEENLSWMYRCKLSSSSEEDSTPSGVDDAHWLSFHAASISKKNAWPSGAVPAGIKCGCATDALHVTRGVHLVVNGGAHFIRDVFVLYGQPHAGQCHDRLYRRAFAPDWFRQKCQVDQSRYETSHPDADGPDTHPESP